MGKKNFDKHLVLIYVHIFNFYIRMVLMHVQFFPHRLAKSSDKHNFLVFTFQI